MLSKTFCIRFLGTYEMFPADVPIFMRRDAFAKPFPIMYIIWRKICFHTTALTSMRECRMYVLFTIIICACLLCRYCARHKTYTYTTLICLPYVHTLRAAVSDSSYSRPFGWRVEITSVGRLSIAEILKSTTPHAFASHHIQTTSSGPRLKAAANLTASNCPPNHGHSRWNDGS